MPIQKKLYLTDLGTDTHYRADRTTGRAYRAEVLGLMHDALKTDENTSKKIIDGAFTTGRGVNKNIVMGMVEIFDLLNDENEVKLKVKNSAHSRGAVQSIIRSNEIQRIIDKLSGKTLEALSLGQMKAILFGTPNDRRQFRFQEYADRYNETALRNILRNIKNVTIDQYLIDPVPGGSVIWWQDHDMHDIPPVVKNCHIRWYQDERSIGFETLVPNVKNPEKTTYVADTLPGHHGTGSGNLGEQLGPNAAFEVNKTDDRAAQWDKCQGVYELVGYQLGRFFSDWSNNNPFVFDFKDTEYDSNKRPLYSKLQAFFADNADKKQIVLNTYQNIQQNLSEYRKFRKTSYYYGYGVYEKRPARHAANKHAPDNYNDMTDIALCVEDLQSGSIKPVNLEHMMLQHEGELFEVSGSVNKLAGEIIEAFNGFETVNVMNRSIDGDQLLEIDAVTAKDQLKLKLIEIKMDRLITAALKQSAPLADVIDRLLGVESGTDRSGKFYSLRDSHGGESWCVPTLDVRLKAVEAFNQRFHRHVETENSAHVKTLTELNKYFNQNSQPSINDEAFVEKLVTLNSVYQEYNRWLEFLSKLVKGSYHFKEHIDRLSRSSSELREEVKNLLQRYDGVIKQQLEMTAMKIEIAELKMENDLKQASLEEQARALEEKQKDMRHLEETADHLADRNADLADANRALTEEKSKLQVANQSLQETVRKTEKDNAQLSHEIEVNHFDAQSRKISAASGLFIGALVGALTGFVFTMLPVLAVAGIALGAALSVYALSVKLCSNFRPEPPLSIDVKSSEIALIERNDPNKEKSFRPIRFSNEHDQVLTVLPEGRKLQRRHSIG